MGGLGQAVKLTLGVALLSLASPPPGVRLDLLEFRAHTGGGDFAFGLLARRRCQPSVRRSRLVAHRRECEALAAMLSASSLSERDSHLTPPAVPACVSRQTGVQRGAGEMGNGEIPGATCLCRCARALRTHVS